MRKSLQTPIGNIGILEEADHIVAIDWCSEGANDKSALLNETCRQIDAYFAGDLTAFDLPLSPRVSAFEKGVLDAMLRIPFGETRTYGDLARELHTQPQAIGQACGANPIPIVIPCHRILAASGLGGYSGAGAVETKIKLLRHERAAGLLI